MQGEISFGAEQLKGINQIYVQGTGFEPVFLGKRHKHLITEMVNKSYNNLDDGSPHYVLSQCDSGNALFMELTSVGSDYFVNRVLPLLPKKDALDREKKYFAMNTIGMDRSKMISAHRPAAASLQLETLLSTNKYESPGSVDDEEVVGPRNLIDFKYDKEKRMNVPLTDTHDYVTMPFK